MAHPRALAAAVALLPLLAASPASARLSKAWTYAELAAKADLVVIVAPTKTTTSQVSEVLPDISENGGPMHALRVATELTLVAPLKGKAPAALTLHHDALPAGKTAHGMVNGPGLVSFDPKAKRTYLMFLVKEADGQYAPVCGQTDPDACIEPLRGSAPD